MIRLECAIVAVVLLANTGQAQYPYVQGGGCNGGQVTGQYLSGPQMYDNWDQVRLREVHRYRGNGLGYGYGQPAVYGFSQPYYGQGYAPSYGYQYGYPAAGGYGGVQSGVPSYYYSAPAAGFAQPYMQCGPNGCTIRYR